MEHYKTEDKAINNAELQNDWQNAENEENTTKDNTDVDFRSAEAGGYGLTTNQSYDASGDPDKEDVDDNDEDNDSDDDATMEEWGDVDPAGGDAPSTPGSAV